MPHSIPLRAGQMLEESKRRYLFVHLRPRHAGDRDALHHLVQSSICAIGVEK